jgi:hypothetical protein
MSIKSSFQKRSFDKTNWNGGEQSSRARWLRRVLPKITIDNSDWMFAELKQDLWSTLLQDATGRKAATDGGDSLKTSL